MKLNDYEYVNKKDDLSEAEWIDLADIPEHFGKSISVRIINYLNWLRSEKQLKK